MATENQRRVAKAVAKKVEKGRKVSVSAEMRRVFAVAKNWEKGQ